MEPDVRKELDALTKRVKELEKNEAQSKRAMQRLSVNLNKLHKMIKSAKIRIHGAEGTLQTIRQSLRKLG